MTTYHPPSHSTRSHGHALLYLTVGSAALGGLLFGYDTGVISGALLYLNTGFHLTSVSKEVAVSAVLVGAILGSLCASWLSNAAGRKPTLLITACIFTAGALLTAFSSTLPVFVFWRLVVGI